MNRIFHQILYESRMGELLSQRENRAQQEPQIKKVDIETWKKSMDEQHISKQDMNNLIMNFFVVEGFKEAAENFKREANINIDESELISLQDEIRGYIFEDKIDDVVQEINKIDEKLFDNNKDLYFELQIQKLINLISESQFIQATEFAKNDVLPLVRDIPMRQTLLEKTMTLMAFSNLEKFPYPDLLGNQRKIKISSMMNHALLRHNSVTTEPKLFKLFKLMKWMQQRLSEKMVFPTMNDISFGTLTMSEME